MAAKKRKVVQISVVILEDEDGSIEVEKVIADGEPVKDYDEGGGNEFWYFETVYDRTGAPGDISQRVGIIFENV